MAKAEKDEDIAFKKETEILKSLETVLKDPETTQEILTAEVQKIAKSYKRMLGDAKVLTSIGDRLQKKLKGANVLLQEQAEEIQKINKEVHNKNIELQLTIDELTRAKAGRRASTIILVLTIMLFAVSEILEWGFQNFFDNGSNIIFLYAFKILLVVGFKPIESLLEGTIISREMKLQREQRIVDAPIENEKVKPESSNNIDNKEMLKQKLENPKVTILEPTLEAEKIKS